MSNDELTALAIQIADAALGDVEFHSVIEMGPLGMTDEDALKVLNAVHGAGVFTEVSDE